MEWTFGVRPGWAIADGWQVQERFQNCAVRLERVTGGVRVVMAAPDGEAMVWTVPA